jgi:mRNA-degrading endonuclease toxin of MazEF toxin-antitoxin module
MTLMPSTITFEPGAIVAVRVRFSDGEGVKKRPVVILTDDIYHAAHADAVVVALTSNLATSRFGDCMIEDWNAAGLPAASKTKGSLHTIERTVGEKQYGKLSVKDLARVRESVRQILGL